MANKEKFMIVLGTMGLITAYLLGAHFFAQQIIQLAASSFTTTITSFETAIVKFIYNGRDLVSASYSL